MPQTASVAIISSRCTNALTGLEQGMHFWLLEKGKNRRTTIKTSSRVEKCASVEKQVSASGGTSSAWVIDCPNQPRGSRARPRLDLLRFKKWICLVGEAYFFPAFGLLIVGKEAGGWQSKEPQQLDGSEEFLRKKVGASGIWFENTVEKSQNWDLICPPGGMEVTPVFPLTCQLLILQKETDLVQITLIKPASYWWREKAKAGQWREERSESWCKKGLSFDYLIKSCWPPPSPLPPVRWDQGKTHIVATRASLPPILSETYHPVCVLTSRPTYQRLITLAADLSEYVWLPQHMFTDHMRDLVIAATKLIRDLPPTSIVLSECVVIFTSVV